MILAEINSLRDLTYDELAREAHRLDLTPSMFPTPDSLRLALIDAIVERELKTQRKESQNDRQDSRHP